ncbi:MAG: hypothetical protein L0154_24440, partial [Chloroflexi bacterium]|nr:hypothetical protein [Chloroflexota bacterium]
PATDLGTADEFFAFGCHFIIGWHFKAHRAKRFALTRLQAHSDWGKITRLAAIAAAYNISVFFNRMLNRPDGALATLIC